MIAKSPPGLPKRNVQRRSKNLFWPMQKTSRKRPTELALASRNPKNAGETSAHEHSQELALASRNPKNALEKRPPMMRLKRALASGKRSPALHFGRAPDSLRSSKKPPESGLRNGVFLHTNQWIPFGIYDPARRANASRKTWFSRARSMDTIRGL